MTAVESYLARLILTNQIPSMNPADLHRQAAKLTELGKQEADRRTAMEQALEIGLAIQRSMAGILGIAAFPTSPFTTRPEKNSPTLSVS